ncbi:hypothetical protein MTR67_004954 [Solanum verrucosum]|uniref:Uncharacterized protein n=1 Tax=Solanum verrucosum TaxID=315347 RepID=A0AAF0Q142_SOLVR|nr:hypothetical protein MTR67_004954 [Solanum verrucosum]
MTTIRLFGNDIKVAEKKEVKSIMLFGTRIFFQSPALNNNMADLPPRSMRLAIESFRGSRPIYMGWKYLENSDINANLSRFLIPVECCSKLLHYMTRLEREKILNKDDRGINVGVMDPKATGVARVGSELADTSNDKIEFQEKTTNSKAFGKLLTQDVAIKTVVTYVIRKLGECNIIDKAWVTVDVRALIGSPGTSLIKPHVDPKTN